MLRLASTSLALLALPLFSGCFSVPLNETGDMKAVMVAGEYRMLINADLPRTLSATAATFRQLGMLEVKHEASTFEASIAARTPQDEKIRVSVREINSLQSEVGIRHGIAGNKDASRALFDRIEANLAR